MNNEKKGFKGWTNYETWLVNFWLKRDTSSQLYWHIEAARRYKEAWMCPEVEDEIWTVERAARVALASQLEREMCDGSPLTGPSLYSDLLIGALSYVDWNEVAEDLLRGVERWAGLDLEGEGVGDPDEDDDDDEYSVKTFLTARRERIESHLVPLFELGKTVITPEALATLRPEDIEKALARHHGGDWGDVGRLAWKENEESVAGGFRLYSIYHSEDGTEFLVITEDDRSSTCVLMPDDY